MGIHLSAYATAVYVQVNLPWSNKDSVSQLIKRDCHLHFHTNLNEHIHLFVRENRRKMENTTWAGTSLERHGLLWNVYWNIKDSKYVLLRYEQVFWNYCRLIYPLKQNSSSSQQDLWLNQGQIGGRKKQEILPEEKYLDCSECWFKENVLYTIISETTRLVSWNSFY